MVIESDCQRGVVRLGVSTRQILHAGDSHQQTRPQLVFNWRGYDPGGTTGGGEHFPYVHVYVFGSDVRAVLHPLNCVSESIYVAKDGT